MILDKHSSVYAPYPSKNTSVRRKTTFSKDSKDSTNKIEGNPILKLAMVKILYVGQKICQKIRHTIR